jgi:hypothetical protein
VLCVLHHFVLVLPDPVVLAVLRLLPFLFLFPWKDFISAAVRAGQPGFRFLTGRVSHTGPRRAARALVSI